MSKSTKVYANEHPKFKKKDTKFKKKDRKLLASKADDEFNEALYEEIRLEEEEFNAWVRENNKRIRDKNKK